MSDELYEIRDMLAQVLEGQQPAPDPTATDPGAGSLIEAMHPGAVPIMGAEGEKAFNDVQQASAANFWTGWPS
jgi:hypothetical protein